MIVFYNTQNGLCIRAANGIASNVIISNGQASNETGLLITDMTNVAYTDVPDQDIYNYDGDMVPSPKLFSALKQGVPDEVKIAALQDAFLAFLGV